MPAPTDPAVSVFLDQAMVALLATRSPAGRPFLTPLWFVADGGTLYLTTGRETRAARNVTRHPEVTVLLGGERGGGDTVLRLRGTATCHAGLPPWRILVRIAVKYYVAPAALAVELRNVAKWGLRARYYAQVKGGPGHLRIVPAAAELLRRPVPRDAGRPVAGAPTADPGTVEDRRA
jgi:hypothetical protein